MRILTSLLGLFVAASAVAQAPIPRASVHGIVFDSIAQVPLPGAVVQVALIDSSGAGAPIRIYTGTSDTDGRYRVDSLPRGKFAIGFQHSAHPVFPRVPGNLRRA